MKVAGTGHRPQSLPCGFDEDHPWARTARREIRSALAELAPELVITGMALGFDQWLAEEAIASSIPVLAAVPFERQEDRWRPEARDRYRAILEQCTAVEFVSEPGYARWKMTARNRWMLEQLTGENDVVLALWDGRESGGTAGTVRMAHTRGRRVRHCWPEVSQRSMND